MKEDETKIDSFESHLRRLASAYPNSVLVKDLLEEWVLLKCQISKKS